MDIINVKETPEFVNQELTEATNKIVDIGKSITRNFYNVAYILSEVNDKELYKEDGFKSAVDYAQKVFNFKKTFAYSLLKIGKEYTAPNLESNLPHDDKDYSVSQVEKMLPLNSRDELIDIINNDEINPDMTVREISDVIKSKMPEKDDNKIEDDIELTKGETDEITNAIKSILESLDVLEGKMTTSYQKTNFKVIKSRIDNISKSLGID